ncbi:Rmf/CrpP fold protein [Streptomyces sp. URMC 129]|uniref:Rmf/CrpP fold protein n=1 Tax=Streptomyces sp. URMC 129 TaxID=3423407 RepID=UPI003F1D61D9
MAAREDIARALAAGAQAARADQPLTTCPYPRDSLLRRPWLRGYVRVKPITGR